MERGVRWRWLVGDEVGEYIWWKWLSRKVGGRSRLECLVGVMNACGWKNLSLVGRFEVMFAWIAK